MSKKSFIARQWLQQDSRPESPVLPRTETNPEKCPIRGRFPTFINHKKNHRSSLEPGDRFLPINCFTPGWKGDSLASKNVMKFQRLLEMVQQDVQNELFKTKDFPRTIKIGLYNEFLSYAETLGLNDEKVDDLGSFWQLITSEELLENESLKQFIDIYANRVAAITFFKLRFISSLLERCQLELNNKALLYPTSFLSQIFKKGSQTELNSRALESNLYSWYSPQAGMKESMRELLFLSRELSITEIIKTISRRTQVGEDQPRVYSHALSHVSVGLFLNSLQINFPMWLDVLQGRFIPAENLDQQQIISCKYFGDYLESLSLSHWLAQENNKNFHWDEMLCPDFKGLEFTSGTFSKICNELQFLTFLVHKAEHQDEKPIEYICKITGGHYRNRKGGSRSGFQLEDNPFYTSTYDRVVLNLCHFPKNNAQHFLMGQILEQVKYLKPNGYLLVLSSKKLFVPSLRDRLGPVLSELKTEAIIDLDNVKGKGELGSYIYIFRKEQKNPEERQLCSYFRISADLHSFQQFSSITEHLRSFYLSHLAEMPTMAQLEFSDSFRVEFFQEAIVNGMLIHSANEDSSRITHPAYFKGLLDNCVPLDSLFEIKPLSHTDKSSGEAALNLGLKKDLSYFLVVDFRKEEVNVELHPMDTYRSIYSDYGQSLCSYFQLIPKIPMLNPNILRNYFLTPVGKQVILLTFSGGQSLVKGRLTKLFIPKFLKETEHLPEHLKTGLAPLEINEEQLLENSPQQVLKAFNHIHQISKDLFPRYSCEILSRFAQFERTLESLICRMDDERFGQKLSFNNPLVQAQLVQRPIRAMYPNNEDIYLEFVNASGPADIHLPLTETQVTVSHEGDIKLHSLELISQGRVIVRLHAEEALILFMNYLMAHASGIAISKLLKSAHVPHAQDLKEIIENSQSFKITYQDLLRKVNQFIMDAFRLHMTPKR